MDIALILGLVLGFGAIISGYLLEHGVLSALFLLSPAVIVFGGTIGAVMIGFPMKEITNVPKLIIGAIKGNKVDNLSIINILVKLCEITKRSGFLALETEINSAEGDKYDPMIKKGALLIADGKNADEIREILESEIYLFAQKKQIEISIFEAAGGYSPTMGIIGTVMGLVQVLSNMSSPEELAKSIAVAFIATLYGVAFANIVYLPIAGKLKINMKMMKLQKELITDGICAISDGANSRSLKERLKEYIIIDGTEKDYKKMSEGI